MLGIHINMFLDFREHHIYITKDVRKLAKTLANRKLSPIHKTTIVEQLLKSKYHATHLGVYIERQLSTIDGILNKAMRQDIGYPKLPHGGCITHTQRGQVGAPPPHKGQSPTNGHRTPNQRHEQKLRKRLHRPRACTQNYHQL
jgi:hypothetical protein